MRKDYLKKENNKTLIRRPKIQRPKKTENDSKENKKVDVPALPTS